MRYTYVMMLIAVVAMTGCGEDSTPTQADATGSADVVAAAVPAALENIEAEVGCGMCSYQMDGVKRCTLAVKIGDEAMLVEGSDIDAHEAGLCKAAKKAVVAGNIEDGKFIATSVTIE